MDLVYIVRPGDLNEELRYSLRSAVQHLTHNRVFVVGHTPSWLTGVESLQTIQAGSKYSNSTRNVLTACCSDEISDPFILMNDDFFVTAPVEEVPTLHRGPMTDVLRQYARRYRNSRRSRYTDGMADSLRLLKSLGHPDPLSYELHVPLVVHKTAMRDAIEAATTAGIEVPHKRSIYGNLAQLGGLLVEDVKVLHSAKVAVPAPFVSTSDVSFKRGWIGRHVRATFDQASLHEALLAKV